MDSIQVTPTTASKINDVDFKNLGFGTVFSDHMLVCDYADGKWGIPKIIAYQPISLMPSAKIFHYGQSIFEGMKAYKDANNQTWLFRPRRFYIECILPFVVTQIQLILIGIFININSVHR